MAEGIRNSTAPFGTGLTVVMSLIPNSWLSWWEPMRYVGLTFGVGLMVWGLFPHIREYLRERKPNRSRVWLFVIAGCGLLIPPWFLVVQSFQSTGFNPKWPDAISCKASIDSGPNSADFSSIILYQSKIMRGRAGLGSVIVYFHAGGMNSKQTVTHRDPGSWARTNLNNLEIGYTPTELWFRTSPPYSLVKKTDLPSNLDAQEEIYAAQFGGLNCGGNDLQTIERNRDAFIFARHQ